MTDGPSVPARIGPYRVIAKLGEETFGPVYLTRSELSSGAPLVAVVTQLTAATLRTPALAASLCARVELAAGCSHPNLARLFGASQPDDGLYVASEYVDGQAWSQARTRLWADGQLRRSLHLSVLADVLAGLHHAHQQQLLHGGVHPGRVFLSHDGQVKLCDLGWASEVQDGRAQQYAAPEQRRKEELDPCADVYAVGVMLWEALARTPLACRPEEAVPDIATVVPDIPSSLAALCMRALAPVRAERFASAAVFRDALLRSIPSASHQPDRAELTLLLRNAFREERARVAALIEAEHCWPQGATPLQAVVQGPAAHESFWPAAGEAQGASAPAEEKAPAQGSPTEARRVVWIRSSVALALAAAMFALLWIHAQKSPPTTHQHSAPNALASRQHKNNAPTHAAAQASVDAHAAKPRLETLQEQTAEPATEPHPLNPPPDTLPVQTAPPSPKPHAAESALGALPRQTKLPSLEPAESRTTARHGPAAAFSPIAPPQRLSSTDTRRRGRGLAHEVGPDFDTRLPQAPSKQHAIYEEDPYR